MWYSDDSRLLFNISPKSIIKILNISKPKSQYLLPLSDKNPIVVFQQLSPKSIKESLSKIFK